jgi:hypothetical protein
MTSDVGTRNAACMYTSTAQHSSAQHSDLHMCGACATHACVRACNCPPQQIPGVWYEAG